MYVLDVYERLNNLFVQKNGECSAIDFIRAELLSFGYKLHSVEDSVYCDCGRGRRKIVLWANTLVDDSGNVCGGGVLQLVGLLSVARACRRKKSLSVRFVFQTGLNSKNGTDRLIDSGVLKNVSTVYAFEFDKTIDSGCIGYRYGYACSGGAEFDISVCGNDASLALMNVDETLNKLATVNGVELKSFGGSSAEFVKSDENKRRYVLSFGKLTNCESFMLDVERTLIKECDRYGAEHRISFMNVYPPLVNRSILVDGIRAVCGERAVEVSAKDYCCSVSECFGLCDGCLVWIGGDTANSLNDVGDVLSTEFDIIFKLITP